MTVLLSTILPKSAALCNDPSQTVYTNDKLLPFAKMVNADFLLNLASNGMPLIEEEVASAVVSAGAVVYPSQPADLIIPIELSERAYGSTGLYVPMVKRAWDPEEAKSTILRYWSWREGIIKFLGATTNRQVKLRYQKTVNAIESVSSAIPADQAEQFFVFKIAEYASRFLGENPSRADALFGQAEMALNQFLNTEVRKTQNIPVRRPAYNWRRGWR